MRSERELKFAILSFLAERGRRNKWNTLGGGQRQGDLELHASASFDSETRARAVRAWSMLLHADLIRSDYANPSDPEDWVSITPSGERALERHALDDLDEVLATISERLVELRDEAWSALERGGPEAFGQAANSMCEVIDQLLHSLAPVEVVKAAPWHEADKTAKSGVTRAHRCKCVMLARHGVDDEDLCRALAAAQQGLLGLKHSHRRRDRIEAERALTFAEGALRQVLIWPLRPEPTEDQSPSDVGADERPAIQKPTSTGEITPQHLEQLGLAHHRGEAVGCPICDARLRVADRASAGRFSVPLRFVCPRDGHLGDFEPPDLRTPWPETTVRQMISDYFRHGEARCTHDGARLGVVHWPSEAGTYIHIGCPSCGRVREGPFEEAPPPLAS